MTYRAERESGERLFTIGFGHLGIPLPPIFLNVHQSQTQLDEILHVPHIHISLMESSTTGWIRLRMCY